MYARRFQILALYYLNHCDASATEEYNQNSALLLLENARIPASVYNTFVTQLVSTSSTQTNLPESQIFLIGKDTLTTVMDKTPTAASSHATMLAAAISAAPETISTPDACLPGLEAIRKLIATAIETNERHDTEDRTTFRITLGDAVELLSDINVEDETVPKLAAMLGKRDYGGGQHFQQDYPNRGYSNFRHEHGGRGVPKHPRDKRQRFHIPHGTDPKHSQRSRLANSPATDLKTRRAFITSYAPLCRGKKWKKTSSES